MRDSEDCLCALQDLHPAARLCSRAMRGSMECRVHMCTWRGTHPHAGWKACLRTDSFWVLGRAASMQLAAVATGPAAGDAAVQRDGALRRGAQRAHLHGAHERVHKVPELPAGAGDLQHHAPVRLLPQRRHLQHPHRVRSSPSQPLLWPEAPHDLFPRAPHLHAPSGGSPDFVPEQHQSH